MRLLSPGIETERKSPRHAKKELEKAVDTIRGKYGIDSIKRASFLKEGTVVDHAVSKNKHLKQKE